MNTTSLLRIVYPVILAVSPENRRLRGREKVVCLSRFARRALALSAEKLGLFPDRLLLLKDESGVPQPFNGYYWSVTHKSTYVAGVVAPERVGIDLEEIRAVSPLLFKKLADRQEWALAALEPLTHFFRYWTSKEAVLKAAGTGIKDLSRCRIERILGHKRLIVDYLDRRWHIEHRYFDGHIASIVSDGFTIRWIL